MTKVRRLLAIRPGEGRLVALLAGLFATVEMGRGLGEVAADTLFISRFGAEFLPWLYVALGLVSLVVALAYGAAVGRLPRGRFLVAVPAVMAVLLVAVRLAVASGAAPVLPLAWLTVNVFAAILMTVVWTVASTTVDARQAKRLYPICTSSAIAGGFAGTLAAGPLARTIGLENLLVLFAGLLAVAGLLTHRIAGSAGRAVVARRSNASLREELRAGFDHVRRSPLLRLVAAAYVLFAVLLFSVTFPFLRAAEQAFPNEADLATALGLLSAAVTAVSFVVSIALANRFYARFGIVSAALLLPLVYLAGFGLWLVQFNLATAVALRSAQQVTQRGMSNAAWSALYAVVPAGRRPQVLAFIDGVPGQLGTSLSGVLLLVVGAAFAGSGAVVPAPVFGMGFGAAMACTWLVILIRRRYGQALIGALRAGLAEQVLEGGPGLAALGHDPDVLRHLDGALASDSPGSRRLALEVLGGTGGEAAIARVLTALDDPSPEVRAAAVRAMAACGAPVDPGRLAGALADDDPRVRAAAVRWVAGDAGLLGERLDDLAADPAAVVRAEAALAASTVGRADVAARLTGALLASPDPDARIAGLGVASATATPPEVLLGLLEDPSPRVRRSAAAALRGIHEAGPGLVGALESATPEGRDAALVALAGHQDPAIRDRVREWALQRAERAVVLRRASATLGSSTPASLDGSRAFLASVLADRERRAESHLLGALAALGAAAATGSIRRSLRSPDADVRAQAIEAIEALGDRRLGRAVVRLLDADAGGAGVDDAHVLNGLAGDADPWLRGLALRALLERSPEAVQGIVQRAAGDGDPIVRTLVGATPVPGDPMADTARTLGELERMMILRRVPLFGELAPEDLQRIASVTDERLYAAGEPLVEEGELGDELIVIVDGTVEVVRGDGEERRVVGAYGPGDHVGELATLREAPRAATVVAGGADVRGLVIGGEGLRAILRERPEAAMAMLATLAERLSRY